MTSLLNLLSDVRTADWMIAFIGFFSILVFLFSVEIGLKYFNISRLYTRKFIHIITGLILCIVAYYLQSNIPIILFSLLYVIIDLWALRKGKFKSIHPDGNSFGTIFYAISVFTLALIFWNELKFLFIITNLIMIIPDAMAALMGEQYARAFFTPLTEKKSLIGMMTMFFLTTIIIISALLTFYHISLTEVILIAVTVGIIATVSELLSFRGSDNLSVPMFSGLYLYVFLVNTDQNIFFPLVIGTFASTFIAYLSYKLKFLDTGGAMLIILMGGIIFGLGGTAYVLPILLFYITSSLLSKIGKDRKKGIEDSYQKTSTRDFYQVSANGGIATFIVLLKYFTDIDLLYSAYIVSLAAATADTWGTELGIYSKKQPLLVSTFKSVAPGTSGGISVIGSVASLSGSILIVSSGLVFVTYNSAALFLMVFFGYLGSVIDSVMGATIQCQYRCRICKKMTESKIHCNEFTEWEKGILFIDNDIVNILSISIATFLYIISFMIKESL